MRFLEVRKALDPTQVFVNQYWRNRFAIEPDTGQAGGRRNLAWDAPEPPHLEKPLDVDAPQPNQALLLGWPSLTESTDRCLHRVAALYCRIHSDH